MRFVDLADRLSVENAFNSALAEAGYFDVLINNARAGHSGLLSFFPSRRLRASFKFWCSVKSN